MSLRDKQCENVMYHKYYYESDVKQALKELIKSLDKHPIGTGEIYCIEEDIKRIFGEELLK